MNKCLFFFFILCVSVINIHAQRPRQKGFVVINNGDTLRGWINYKNHTESPKQISFYADSLSTQGANYMATDLRSFEINGGDAFIRGTVGKDVPFAEILLNSTSPGDTTLKQTVFLRVLLVGANISLYEWVDERERYYARENTGDYLELKLKKMNDGSPDLALYKSQLTVLATKYDKQRQLASAIENSRYDEASLESIVISLNGQANVIRDRTRHYRTQLSFFAGGGISIASMKISGDKSYIGNLAFKESARPYFSGGIELSGFGVERLALRLDIAYASAVFEGEGLSTTSSINKITYQVQQRNMAVALSPQYNIIEKKMFNAYVAVGASANFSSYSGNTWHQSFPELTLNNYASLKKTWVAGTAKLGVLVARKLEIYLARPFYDDFIFKSTNYSFDHPTYYLWVGYHFRPAFGK